MSFKIASTSQLNYSGNQGSAADMWRRFPAGSQSIATAPERSATPIVVYESNGQGHWALHHNGAWRKLSPYKDFRDGSVSWRMDGTEVPNPVAWSMPQKKA